MQKILVCSKNWPHRNFRISNLTIRIRKTLIKLYYHVGFVQPFDSKRLNNAILNENSG